MTDGEIRELVIRLFDEWSKRLLLDSWDVDLILAEDGHPDDDNGLKTGADTVAEWRYRRAKIRFYLHNLRGMSVPIVERLMVHELCHVLLSGFEDLREDLDEDEYPVLTALQEVLTERITCDLERVLLAAYGK